MSLFSSFARSLPRSTFIVQVDITVVSCRGTIVGRTRKSLWRGQETKQSCVEEVRRRPHLTRRQPGIHIHIFHSPSTTMQSLVALNLFGCLHKFTNSLRYPHAAFRSPSCVREEHEKALWSPFPCGLIVPPFSLPLPTRPALPATRHARGQTAGHGGGRRRLVNVDDGNLTTAARRDVTPTIMYDVRQATGMSS